MTSDRLTHPFQRWPQSRRRLTLVVVAIAAFVPTVLGTITKPLHEDVTGESIIDFELAGSVDRANEILAAWREEGVIDEAKAIQVFDLVYPLIYSAALAGACVAAAGAWRRRGRPSWAQGGSRWPGWPSPRPGFDYVENLGLGISLWDEPMTPWPQIALVAALASSPASTRRCSMPSPGSSRAACKLWDADLRKGAASTASHAVALLPGPRAQCRPPSDPFPPKVAMLLATPFSARRRCRRR